MRLVEAEPVVELFVLPALELNDQVDLRRGLYAAHAKELLNVHHADAAHLEIVTDELGRGAGERIADAADLHRVVRNEPVAALDQLDGRLALADAAVAEDQYALAVHVHQHAVARDHGRQLVVEEVDGHARKLDRGVLRAQQGAAVFLRHLHALGEHVELAGDDQRGDLVLEQILKAFAPLGGGKALEEHRLRLADDLEPARVKVVEKADELQPRAVDVRDGQRLRLEIRTGIEHLHLKFFHNILYLYASIGIHKLSPVGSKFFHIHYIGFPLFLQGYAASFFRSPSASERSEKKMQKNLRK